ncbi:3-methyl-2-oxobutanoate hydroxymethyltransferase [Trichophyton soudanense CBS 452.61]|uniref:3-methyl-2-oxobutanoate hydroxymethyltransferase n=1 Tax=Trichophyton soudanense CBS 452.61 TaxID=1215331 RepID=A0A022XPT5_TRISD|nr:3-methyl-2-oxobutanoate hydroxymethyltransferase [Trichophyton soudanense CBS 452.61]EZG05384.1 3-methyl-2-oxobutanoate hydroxymethyltransferase [Trichophyton rubrum CBS 735.88]
MASRLCSRLAYTRPAPVGIRLSGVIRPTATTTSTSKSFPPAAKLAATRQQERYSSNSPMEPAPSHARKKVTIKSLEALYRKGEPITMMTAHDFPSANVCEAAGMEMILIGDSLAMVALGMNDTSEVTLEEMIVHCRSVSRAAASAFVVGDMPMGSYEISEEQAVQTAIRLVKEGRVQGIKIEGGQEITPIIKRIVKAGIPVVAHVGLTPQRQNALGGFRVQGKSMATAMKVYEDALAVQEAGAFMTVVEAVPAEIASIITKKLRIPTIGIGAGNGCSGQVLVQIDMLGNYPPGRFLPKFVKKYGDVWSESLRAIEQYKSEVKSREYPSPEYSYPTTKEVVAEFEKVVGEK